MTTELQVCETFSSIQGESTFAGRPCFFIRLSGCNLRCRYCDTRYAYRNGKKRSIPSLMSEFAESGLSLVEVTGGEPLLQAGVYELLAALARKATVLLETNGTLPVLKVPRQVVAIIDVKCPGSGFADENCWQNMRRLRAHDEVKFVICGRTDYDWARKVMEKYRLAGHCRAVNFSPAAGSLKPQTLASWIIHDCLPVRLNCQLHRKIWPKATRGK